MTEPDIARSLFSGPGSQDAKSTSGRRKKSPDPPKAPDSMASDSAATIKALEATIVDLTQALEEAGIRAITPEAHQGVIDDLNKAHQKIEELTYRLDLSQKSEQKLRADIQALEIERDNLKKQLQSPAQPPAKPPMLAANPKHTQPMAIKRPVFAHPVDDDQDMPSFMLD